MRAALWCRVCAVASYVCPCLSRPCPHVFIAGVHVPHVCSRPYACHATCCHTMPYQTTDVGFGMHTRKIEEVDASAIDRIFSSSRRLSDEAIVDFVRHLCEVSRQPLWVWPVQEPFLQWCSRTSPLRWTMIADHRCSRTSPLPSTMITGAGSAVDDDRELSHNLFRRPLVRGCHELAERV